MQQFTIRDIENLTGIKAHTLRIWEQRYGFLKPQRKESLHRIYDNEDLKQMLRIAFLYHSGWKVSRIAALEKESMIELISKAPVAPENAEVFVHSLTEAALDYDEHKFLSVFNSIVEKTGFETAILKVGYPYLVKIGHLWSTNHVIPAQEHFTSYIIQNLIIRETEKVARHAEELKPIILFTPEGEFHELPLLFINYLLRKNGFPTIYLGVNVKVDSIRKLAENTSVSAIYIHFVSPLLSMDLDIYLEKLLKLVPGCPVSISGSGAQQLQRQFSRVSVLKSDIQIQEAVQKGMLI